MKSIVVSLLAIFAHASAMASYELALVADGNKIHRFDTESGAYLGSFGRFGGTLRDMATDQTTGSTFAYDNSGVLSKYNYSTGNAEPVAITATVSSLNLVGGEVWAQNNLTVTRYNQNLGVLGSFTLASTNSISSMHVLNGKIFTFEISAGTGFFRRYSLGGVFESQFGAYNPATTGFGRIGSSRYIGGGSTDLLTAPARLSSTDVLCYTFLTGATPGVSSMYTTSSLSLVRDTAATHTGGVYVGQSILNAAQGALVVLSPTVSEVAVLGTSILTAPQAVNVIVAPEPGSLLAFGLGGLLLLRRKK